MTYEEAKKLLKRHCSGCMHPQQMGWCKSHCEIGIAIEALEKQIPKEVMDVWSDSKCVNGHFLPVPCRNSHMKYCPMCGQKLDWDEYWVRK